MSLRTIAQLLPQDIAINQKINYDQAMEIKAKKSLGQHFLTSKHVLGQIMDAAEIRKGGNVLEIGPGTGILTRALLEKGANLIAIEKDDRALEVLNNLDYDRTSGGSLKLIAGDILEENMARLGLKNGEYALIANIPYYITGAILEKFLEYEPRPQRMVLLVQKEVADRIVARPENGEKQGKESILSISVKAFGQPEIVARVPKGAFSPPPGVDSAILAINNISDANFRDENIRIDHFFEILRAGFAHKRKYLKRNLEKVISRERNDEIWLKMGLDDKIRAEDITFRQWLQISSMCS